MKANRRLVYAIVSSGLAILFALALSGVILAVSGNNPFEAYGQMFEYGVRIDSLSSAVNRAVPLYFSAMAVAVGFKMGLFNIGVEGQYRIAVLIAAAVGAAITLPGPLQCTGDHAHSHGGGCRLVGFRRLLEGEAGGTRSDLPPSC